MTTYPTHPIIIPINVRHDKNLSPGSKLLYGEFTAILNKKGYCTPTNKYFTELYHVSTTTINNWINSLKQHKYIRIKMKYKKGSKEIEKRCIYVNHFISKNKQSGVKK